MNRKITFIVLIFVLAVLTVQPAFAGVQTANGWYEGEEIYYLALGFEDTSSRGQNDIYLIGGDRKFQAQVVEFIPGEPGYSPHWNVNVVNTAPGVTVQDIIDAGLASDGFDLFGDEPFLFNDVADILAAEDAGLVTIAKPGLVVLCPIVSEEAAEAPGNVELGLTDTFVLNEGF